MSDFCTMLSEKQKDIAKSLGISLDAAGMLGVLSALKAKGKNLDNVTKHDVEVYLNLLPDTADMDAVCDEITEYQNRGLIYHY